jgi:hypothetical protein
MMSRVFLEVLRVDSPCLVAAAFGATKKRHFNKSIIHLNGSISKTIEALFYGTTAKRHLGDAAKRLGKHERGRRHCE